MGLKAGVSDGAIIYLNHTPIRVSAVAEVHDKKAVCLTIESIKVTLEEGQQVDIADGVTVSYLGRSSANVHRLDIEAPDTVCVTRADVYSGITGQTKGLLVSQPLYKWAREWQGYTREQFLSYLNDGVLIDHNGSPALEVGDYIFKSNDGILVEAELRETDNE